jgi:hypothetical protein
MVTSSAMALEFLLQRDQHVGMRFDIDLALEDALGTGDGQISHPVTQFGPGVLDLLRNLGLG